jgi:hypothetical protein
MRAGRNQPASLVLDAWPEHLVGNALPTLLHYRRRIMAGGDQQVGDLSREIF